MDVLAIRKVFASNRLASGLLAGHMTTEGFIGVGCEGIVGCKGIKDIIFVA